MVNKRVPYFVPLPCIQLSDGYLYISYANYELPITLIITRKSDNHLTTRKIMKKTLLILTTLLISAASYSQTFIVNNISYEVTSTSPNTVKTTNYNTAGGTTLNIPSTVTDNSITYTVTRIGFNSFSSKLLTSVVIPNTITVIEGQAFANNNLTSITLPEGLTTISNSVFYTNQITSITIPSTVTSIDFAAFRDNPLTSVISKATVPPAVYTGGINDSFYNRTVIALTVPFGTTAAYTTNAAVGAEWTGFSSVTEAPATTTSINQQNIADIFYFYPNPASAQLFINTDKNIGTIVIKDITGTTVETIMVPSNSIDISGLTNGIYFLQTQIDNVLITEKFIKE